MNKFSKLLISSLFLSSALFASVNSSAGENQLKVRFKENISEKYIRVISLMTDTELKSFSDGFYYLSPNKAGSDIKKYSSLYSKIPEVNSVYPAPEERFIYDKLKSGDIIAGLILVKFRADTPPAKILEIDKKYKTESRLFTKGLNLYKVLLPKSLSVSDAIKIFNGLKIVEYAEADRVMRIQDSQANNKIYVKFRSGQEELSIKLFNLVYNTKLIKENNAKGFMLELPDNINLQDAIELYRLCPYIVEVKVAQE